MNRRQLLTSALVGGASVAAAGSTTAYAAAALPPCSMEAVLKSAQWDPVKSDTGITSGSGPSVLLVEQALVAQGLLSARFADGHFGTSTVAAYRSFQQSLGYSGIAANGIPGPSSFAALAANRFTVTRPVAVGTKVAFRGWTVNTRTRSMLTEAEAHVSRKFVLTQGSYNPGGDPTSAGTHDGGGVVDLDAESLTPARRSSAVAALRAVGFAAWVRSPSQGDWPWHIHAVAISDTDLAPQAQRQVGKYFEGRNGLANDLPDDGPAVPKVTWEEYLRGPHPW